MNILIELMIFVHVYGMEIYIFKYELGKQTCLWQRCNSLTQQQSHAPDVFKLRHSDAQKHSDIKVAEGRRAGGVFKGRLLGIPKDTASGYPWGILLP